MDEIETAAAALKSARTTMAHIEWFYANAPAGVRKPAVAFTMDHRWILASQDVGNALADLRAAMRAIGY